MSAPREFPIHSAHKHLIPSVPWALVAPHEAQAQSNHRQSIERLAERGGLSLAELVAVLENRPFRRMNDVDALLAAKAAIRAFREIEMLRQDAAR